MAHPNPPTNTAHPALNHMDQLARRRTLDANPWILLPYRLALAGPKTPLRATPTRILLHHMGYPPDLPVYLTRIHR